MALSAHEEQHAGVCIDSSVRVAGMRCEYSHRNVTDCDSLRVYIVFCEELSHGLINVYKSR